MQFQVASQIDHVQTTQMQETMKLMAKAKEETGKVFQINLRDITYDP